MNWGYHISQMERHDTAKQRLSKLATIERRKQSLSTRSYQKFRSTGWKGRIDHQWQGVTNHDDPLSQLLQWPHSLVHERPMSRTWRVQAPYDTIFVKLVSSTSRHGIKPGRWEARIKHVLRPSVSLRTLRMTRRMIDCGLQVPDVLMVANRRRGWHYDDVLACREVEGNSLTDLLTSCADLKTVRHTLIMLGQRVAHLHQSGFVHGHLVPGHIMVAPDRTDVSYLDNDETQWRSGGVSLTDRCRNLTQLVLRLNGGFHPHGYATVRWFLDAYFKRTGLDGQQQRQCQRRVLNQARQRAVKYNRPSTPTDRQSALRVIPQG